ncbi:MAG TPA: hypothetical protein GX525_07305 [Bacilli bacterium]|nr:hypothetical protein [Bacilli bacterium]
MEEKKLKDLQHKIEDYRRFAFTLLSLSSFLYIGLIIPNGEGLAVEPTILLTVIVVSLVVAMLFHRKSLDCNKKLWEEID